MKKNIRYQHANGEDTLFPKVRATNAAVAIAAAGSYAIKYMMEQVEKHNIPFLLKVV
jgi:hypothetical protein